MKDIRFSDRDRLFILGDIIDRGPASMPLFLDVMSRENITCILGNHEYMMWEYLGQKPGEMAGSTLIRNIDWVREGNGGLETCKEYLKLTKEQQKQCLDYVRSMYLQYELQLEHHTYMLSHSFFVQNEGTLKWKEVAPNVVFGVIWNSPWRIWEFVSKELYKDNNVHIVGHVHLQAVHEAEAGMDYLWKPEAYITEDGSLINIDCGCSVISKNKFAFAGLCCMNLTEYDKGHKDEAFRYYWA